MSEIAELSDAAKLTMGGTFGWGAVVTFNMVENEPSPEMVEVLDELMNAGLILQEIGSDDMPRGALRYRVNPLVDDLNPYRKMAAEIANKESCPKIRLFVKRTP